MTIVHAGYPQHPHHHLKANPTVLAVKNNSPVGGAYHLRSDENIGGGVQIRGGNANAMMSSRRISDASSDESFEMSRPTAYVGRDTDRFFGEFEMDDDVVGGNGALYEDEYVEDEDEPISELMPLGGGTRRVPRTPRNKSISKCSFYDFYKLTNEHLGSGAYGSVTTCKSISTDIEYAVKIVDKQGETHSRHRILREVNIFKACKNHPNIVQLIDWFEDEDNFYLVMEKMRGGPLLQHILQRGYFTEEEARRVTKDIAMALKYMHDRGIAHRDVKPENVLCTDPAHVSPVKLCDLDLASQRPPHAERMSLSQVASEPDLASPVGSAEFMAPEVVDAFVGDALKYDKKCDTWSLGVILYIMLAGYAPFQGECDDGDCGWSDGQPCEDCQKSLFERIQDGYYEFPEEEWGMISSDAKDLVSRLLKRDPTERYNADQILSHKWIKQSAPSTILSTPSNLTCRKDSARDVAQMSEHFNLINRLADRNLSARFDKMSLSDENGGATATVHDNSFLLVGGEPFGGFPPMKSMTTSGINIETTRSGEFTPPVSRASPTTPPPSMMDLTADDEEQSNDSGLYNMFSPQSTRSCDDGEGSPLPKFVFGITSPMPPVQLFGEVSSIQMTPRQTTEDDTSLRSFGADSPTLVKNDISEATKPIRLIETEVNV